MDKETEAGGPAAPESQADKSKKENKKAELPGVQALTLVELRAMKVEDLRRLCKEAGVSAAGKAEELIDRLRPKCRRLTRKWVPGVTVCAFCGEAVTVQKTVKQPSVGGQIDIIRTLRCRSRHSHTYPLVETVSTEAAAAIK